MAWTATLYQVNKDETRPTAVILFTDGAKYKRLETIDLNGLTSSSFRARVDAMRKGFESSYTFIDTLTVDFNLTPDAPAEIDAKAVAKQKYFIDFNTLQRMQQAIAQGLMSDTDQIFLDQQALVKSEFLPSYTVT